jgi:hypothetical protein
VSVSVARVVLWALGIVALFLLVTMGHASFEKQGIFNWEFVGFLLSYGALDQCIRADERLKNRS